jgi:hypothetical protein
MPNSNWLSKHEFSKILLFVLISFFPILGYWLYCSYLAPISPSYQAYDPEFQYFLNSLAIFKGGSYTYIDHPGTPLEIIGSLILGATYPFLTNSQPGFILYHLENPGLFLGLARGFIVLMSCGCALLFYVTARSSKRLEAALIASALSMMFFVIHPFAFNTLVAWAHNSWNFPFGTLILVVLFIVVNKEEEVAKWKLIGIGLGIGILTAVTIYFATWVAGAVITVIVLYRLQNLSWQKTAFATATLIVSWLAGFFLVTLPILKLYPRFADWVIRLMFHQGVRGHGPQGIISASLMPANIMALFQELPILFMSVGIEFLLLIFVFFRWRKRVSEKPGLWSIAVGLSLQLIFVSVSIFKHPANIYMLSVAAIVPVLMLVILELFKYDVTLHRILGRIFVMLVLAGLVVSFYNAVIARRSFVAYVRNVVKLTSRALNEYSYSKGRTPDNLVILWTYGTYSPCYSLWFANDYADNIFSKDIKRICGNQLEINIWNMQSGSKNGLSMNWDVLVTRSRFLGNPYSLNQLGTIYKELQGTGNAYGPIILISNTK